MTTVTDLESERNRNTPIDLEAIDHLFKQNEFRIRRWNSLIINAISCLLELFACAIISCIFSRPKSFFRKVFSLILHLAFSLKLEIRFAHCE